MLEWKNTVYDCEQNYTRRENISLITVENFSFLDLRCHVILRTNFDVKFMDILEICKSKITYLQIQVFIYQEIIKLHIKMGNFLILSQLKNIKHLTHKKSTRILTGFSYFLHHFEKTAICNDFSYQV